MTFEITPAAERDIRAILSETLKTFGTRQLSIYQTILNTGVALIAETPERPGTLARPKIGANVRSYHLELAAGRRGGAAHCLYYTTAKLSNGTIGTAILRVLHEHMEPRHKVVRSLKQFTTDDA